jgi:nucleoside-diphosphate kinase
VQRTLVLLKPDCVQRRLIGAILQRFEQKGLRLVGMKLIQASQQVAAEHYAVHSQKPFYPSLLKFIMSAPTVAVVLEGPDAVAVVRLMMGETNGAKSPAGTIRGDFAISVQNNLIHGSDSAENAKTEIALWFQEEELVNYTPVDNHWIAG